MRPGLVRAVFSAAGLALWALGGAALALGEPVVRLGPPVRPPVRRLVTLAPSLTDIALSVGGRGALVGVSRYDELPDVQGLPRVGGFADPSVEAVLALSPDLVLGQPGPGNRGAIEKLAAMGVSVLLFSLADVAAVEVAMREVGRALGRPADGEQQAALLEEARARSRRRAAKLPRVKVLFLYGTNPLVVAGPGSFADQLLADAGGQNVVGGRASAWVVLPEEVALSTRPDVVVSAARSTPGEDRLRALAGLREARWERLSDQALMLPGPRLVRGLEELFSLVHGAAVDAGQGP